MPHYKKLFEDHLQKQGIRYSELKTSTVKVCCTGHHLKNFPIYVCFEKNGDKFVQLRCGKLADFRGREFLGRAVCRKMNRKFKEVDFCLQDGAVTAIADARLPFFGSGRFCLQLMQLFAQILDEAYPMLPSAGAEVNYASL